MLPNDFEAQYYSFLLEKGYISDKNREEIYREYLAYVSPGDHVLDIGCGEGIFLNLLQGNGCTHLGVDADIKMVETARAKGLNIEHQDAIIFLESVEPESFDCIIASNFVEHLVPSDVLKIFQLSYKALRPHGKIIIATPNPSSIIVHLYEFWRDATHNRLYDLQLLEFLLSYTNFDLVDKGTNDFSLWDPQLKFSVEKAKPSPQTDQAIRFIEESLAQPATIDSVTTKGKFRSWLAKSVYQITREIDLRISRIEILFQHYLRINKAETETINQLIERQNNLIDYSNRLQEVVAFSFQPREIFVVGKKKRK